MRSTKGIKIDAALAAGGGLQWNRIGDRTFRLIDAKNGVTLGCKLIPKLLKISTYIADDIIYFNIEGLRYTYVLLYHINFMSYNMCIKVRRQNFKSILLI